jgi:hypothetical protein
MSYTGMDINDVRQLATRMNSAADEILQTANTLTQALQGTTWVGPDRERFVGDWTSSHMAQINNVVTAIHDAATRANHNATEQEQASNT